MGLWASAACSTLGDGLSKTALPLFAVSLARSPTLVAGATFALTLRWALFALVPGVLADRVDRRRLMVPSAWRALARSPA